MIKEYFNIPNFCPICGAPTEKHESESGTAELYCSNPDCNGKLVNKLDHFAGKKGLDIKGLSKATLSKLIDWGWVRCISDLFTLDKYRKDWIEKPGFGVKSVDNILNAIEISRNCTCEDFISAMGIPLIGKTYARELALTFGDYEAFRFEIDHYFDFAELEGFGPEKHNAIVTFDYSMFDMMYETGIIKIDMPESTVEVVKSLEGKSIAITGKLKLHKNRDELKAKIEAAGGKVVSSVTSKTNYLVNNDNTSESSKNKTAKALNIPIITEEELLNILC